MGWYIPPSEGALPLYRDGISPGPQENSDSPQSLREPNGGRSHVTELVTGALAQAVAVRGGDVGGTIMHSDRGTQYTAQAMVKACADAGLRRSMGATGICWDNSGAESLWSTFKHEYYYRHTFATKAELVAAVDKWMHFYNTQRRHSVIGMLSPIAYEQSLDAAPQAA